MNYMAEYEKALRSKRRWDDEKAREEVESIRESIRHEVMASYAALTESSEPAMIEARDAVYRERRADIEKALHLLMAHSHA
jgi:hypothetical protein